MCLAGAAFACALSRKIRDPNPQEIDRSLADRQSCHTITTVMTLWLRF